MQNSLRPSIRQPDSVRVARVPGRVRSWPGSLMAAAGDAVAGDLRERGGEAAAALLSGRDRHLAAALHVEHRDECMFADRDRGVASCQAGRRHHQVVRGRHAEPAELDRHGRSEVAPRLERLDRLEGVAASRSCSAARAAISSESRSASATSRAPGSVRAVSSIGVRLSGRCARGRERTLQPRAACRLSRSSPRRRLARRS